MPKKETEEINEINRPICPNCNTQLKIVKVVSCHDTDYYWDCNCMIKAWSNDIYDRTDYS